MTHLAAAVEPVHRGDRTVGTGVESYSDTVWSDDSAGSMTLARWKFKTHLLLEFQGDGGDGHRCWDGRLRDEARPDALSNDAPAVTLSP